MLTHRCKSMTAFADLAYASHQHKSVGGTATELAEKPYKLRTFAKTLAESCPQSYPQKRAVPRVQSRPERPGAAQNVREAHHHGQHLHWTDEEGQREIANWRNREIELAHGLEVGRQRPRLRPAGRSWAGTPKPQPRISRVPRVLEVNMPYLGVSPSRSEASNCSLASWVVCAISRPSFVASPKPAPKLSRSR